MPRRRSQRKRQSSGKPVAAKMQQQFKTMQKDVALMFIPRTLQQELGCNPSALKLHGYRNCALDCACSQNLLTRSTHPLPLLLPFSFFNLLSCFLLSLSMHSTFLFLKKVPIFLHVFWWCVLMFFMFWALAPIPLGFAPYPLKIDTLESFRKWKSWLWDCLTDLPDFHMDFGRRVRMFFHFFGRWRSSQNALSVSRQMLRNINTTSALEQSISLWPAISLMKLLC